MKYPTTRLVFDRKHTASATKKALVQLEVLFEGRKKYITTGVKVYKDQWSAKQLVHGSMEAVTLNERIKAMKGKMDGWINELIENGTAFEWEKLEAFLKRSEQSEKRFVDFVEEMIETRKDIRDSTRKTHRKLVGVLYEFGRIIFFSDLTKANVVAFDDYLHGKGIKQTTVYTYHKHLKTYIHEAMRRELLDSDPYVSLKFKRGESESGRYLTEEELKELMAASLPTESLRKVRDLFVVQCLTGMAYSDIIKLDFGNVELRDGQYVLSDERAKTGVDFTVVLLPEVLEILKKYDYRLPKFSNQQYNMRLKLVADAAGIDKPIASHWGRRTFGMYLLNNGFSMEVVAKVLGHKSIKTTEATYAKILDKSVENAFRKFTGGNL
ncbi:tyrosine-type recombinase/integrase [Segatella buccae]